jgi:hypothetical protein
MITGLRAEIRDLKLPNYHSDWKTSGYKWEKKVHIFVWHRLLQCCQHLFWGTVNPRQTRGIRSAKAGSSVNSRWTNLILYGINGDAGTRPSKVKLNKQENHNKSVVQHPGVLCYFLLTVVSLSHSLVRSFLPSYMFRPIWPSSGSCTCFSNYWTAILVQIYIDVFQCCPN